MDVINNYKLNSKCDIIHIANAKALSSVRVTGEDSFNY